MPDIIDCLTLAAVGGPLLLACLWKLGSLLRRRRRYDGQGYRRAYRFYL